MELAWNVDKGIEGRYMTDDAVYRRHNSHRVRIPRDMEAFDSDLSSYISPLTLYRLFGIFDRRPPIARLLACSWTQLTNDPPPPSIPFFLPPSGGGMPMYGFLRVRARMGLLLLRRPR